MLSAVGTDRRRNAFDRNDFGMRDTQWERELRAIKDYDGPRRGNL
jgi:hypothetical protein